MQIGGKVCYLVIQSLPNLLLSHTRDFECFIVLKLVLTTAVTVVYIVESIVGIRKA